MLVGSSDLEMSRSKKKKKKHWRKYLKNNLLPPKFILIETFAPLVDKLVSVIVGEQHEPRDLYRRFHRAFNTELYGTGNSSLSSLVLKTLLSDRQDIQQQCFLYLIEIWDWCTRRWKSNRKSGVVFYDYVRALLPRYIGTWLAIQIREYSVGLHPPTLSPCNTETGPGPEVTLGWVMLSAPGPLSFLTVKQKYLLYLRYSKKLTIIQIADLIQQHRARVEKDFSVINKLIEGEQNAVTRNCT